MSRLDDIKKISDVHEIARTLPMIREFLCRPYEPAYKSLRAYQETESRLVAVSGCDMDKLIELFAAGYTLRPPNRDNCKPFGKMSDL